LQAVVAWHAVKLKGRVLRKWHFAARRATAIIARAAAHGQDPGMHSHSSISSHSISCAAAAKLCGTCGSRCTALRCITCSCCVSCSSRWYPHCRHSAGTPTPASPWR
jgi:hypothetical protein